jgi:hypothetical protein
MGGVGTSILGRPRHLPRDRRASHHPTSDYTLNCEEPDNRPLAATVRSSRTPSPYSVTRYGSGPKMSASRTRAVQNPTTRRAAAAQLTGQGRRPAALSQPSSLLKRRPPAQRSGSRHPLTSGAYHRRLEPPDPACHRCAGHASPVRHSQLIAIMRRRLAVGQEVARMYQEPGLAWLERQAEVAEDLVVGRRAAAKAAPLMWRWPRRPLPCESDQAAFRPNTCACTSAAGRTSDSGRPGAPRTPRSLTPTPNATTRRLAIAMDVPPRVSIGGFVARGPLLCLAHRIRTNPARLRSQ